MTKRIIAMLLAAITLFAFCACGTEDTSKDASTESQAESKAETSADASADNTSTDASAETSEEASSESSESSEDGDVAIIKDKDGYKQFQKVAKVDKVLAERGFLDVGANSDYKPLNYDVMKAAWISQGDFGDLYTNGKKQRSETSFKKLVIKAYDNLISMGYNTVIVQVRPNADSFYPSAYYAPSYYVVGSYGNKFSYDALEIMIDIAHKKGLSFQAWVNPMRGMSETNLGNLNNVYVMKDWTSVANKKKCARYIYVHQANKTCYLNISFPEVRELIIDGIAEIVRHYDVDGIHMDDYFYFAGDDALDVTELAEAQKKNATINKQKFRYGNLNKLISGVYEAIKTENPNVIFGISPAGNLDSMATTYYADVRTWLSKDGYVDYIMPQLYFGMEHGSWAYDDAYQRWSAIKTNPNVRFMVGMSFGKALMGYNGNPDQYAGAGANEWIENKDVLKKCLTFAKQQKDFTGYAFFAYSYQFDPLTGKPNPESAEEVKNLKPVLESIKSKVIEY